MKMLESLDFFFFFHFLPCAEADDLYPPVFSAFSLLKKRENAAETAKEPLPELILDLYL